MKHTLLMLASDEDEHLKDKLEEIKQKRRRIRFHDLGLTAILEKVEERLVAPGVEWDRSAYHTVVATAQVRGHLAVYNSMVKQVINSLGDIKSMDKSVRKLRRRSRSKSRSRANSDEKDKTAARNLSSKTGSSDSRSDKGAKDKPRGRRRRRSRDIDDDEGASISLSPVNTPFSLSLSLYLTIS